MKRPGTTAKANYGILAVAVCCEVSGSLALKQAADQPLWMLLTLVADGIAFFLLSVLLRRGMPLSVAYGLWGAGGVALTALLSTVLFGEPFTLLMGAGIALVIAGVLLVEFGAQHSGSPDVAAGASAGAGAVPHDEAPSHIRLSGERAASGDVQRPTATSTDPGGEAS